MRTKPLIFIGKHAWPAALLFLIFLFPLMAANGPSAQRNPQVLSAQDPLYARGRPPAEKPEPVPVKIAEPDLSFLSADSFMAYDIRTGEILAQKDPATTLGVASLTKLMTALVVYESLDMNSGITVRPADTLNVSPSLNLKVGDSVLVKDLFSAMLVGSCNDAALALANHTAQQTGKKFEELMNQKAQELGMTTSHFSNPMGFDSTGNFSTAEDIKRLVDETLKHEVFTFEGRRPNYAFVSGTGIRYRTVATNRLIKDDPEITSIKTGYTDRTGGSMVIRAERNGNSVVLIILNSENRESDTLNLKEQIFSNFAWQTPTGPN